MAIAGLTVIAFALVNAGIVVTHSLIGIAVRVVIHCALVIAGIVVTRIVIVRIRIGVVVVGISVTVGVIVRVPPGRPPGIESHIEDHPCSINEAAAMAVPPMIAVAVPIPMPIPRTLRKHVFPPVATETIVSISQLASAIWLVPHACGPIYLIRQPRKSVSLADTCSREWTGPGVRYPAWIYNWAAKRNPLGRAHRR